MKFWNAFKEAWKRNEYTPMYIATGIAVAFCFLFMQYKDNLTISSIGYWFANSVLTGNFVDYYNSMDWSYGVTIYSIYAIWSIPVWIIFKVTGLAANLTAIPVLLWYKLLTALFAAWCVYLTGKVLGEVCKDREKEVRIQCLSSFFLVFPVFAIGQCDIIGLCFVLLGIYYYLKEKDVKFLICFCIAVTMKYFALFVFIPLILFRFRKISKLLKVFAAGMILVLFTTIFVGNSDAGAAAQSNSQYYVNDHIQKLGLLRINIDWDVAIGLLALSFCTLCIVAYSISNVDKEKNKQYTLWLAMAGYMIFFLFYPCNIYWYVLLAPFWVLVACRDKRLMKVNLLLEIIFGLMTGIIYSYTQYWVLGGEGTFSYLFLKDNIMPRNSFQFFVHTVFGTDLEVYLHIFRGIAYACAGAFLFLNFPGRKAEIASNETEEEMRQDIKAVTWMKIGVLYLWIFFCVYSLVKLN